MNPSFSGERIWHREYNLAAKHNLPELPPEAAVFGVFAVMNGEPVHCRYIGPAANLREAVTALYESPESEGLRQFMQGPWIKIVQYHLLPGSSEEERAQLAREWSEVYNPMVDISGDYPGYY